MQHIYIIEGGIGKHIMFSAMIEKLSEKHNQKIAIMSAYPDLFKYHPKVVFSVSFDEPGFYDRWVLKNKCEIHHSEPYYSNYLKGRSHLIKEWTKLYGIKYNIDLPDVWVDSYSIEECKRFVKQNKDFIIVQFSGGQSPLGFNKDVAHTNHGQFRDYPRPLAQQLINLIHEKHPNLTILNYSLPNESTFGLEHTISIEAPYLFYISLLNYAKGYICIDSSLQHFAANKYNKKKGVVLWGSTGPKQLGYKKNINLSNAKINHIRPLTKPFGDILNYDGTPWKNEDISCMDIDPNLVLQKFDDIMFYNEDIESSNDNVIQIERPQNNQVNEIELDEKTSKLLLGLRSQLMGVDKQYSTIIQTVLASNNINDNFILSDDGTKLVKAN